jgi:hypothetical protein
VQKWEYLELRVFGPEWADSAGHFGKLESVPTRSGTGPQRRWTASQMNVLGDEGWELSGFADDESPNAYTAFFKRPKP